MKLALLIMAHKAPSQVARLCNRLRSESVDLYVHVDAKSDQSQFTKLIKDVHFVEDRVSVKWGQLSQVEAMLSLVKATELDNYDYVAFISGQDYPLMQIEKILEELQCGNGKEYINARRLDPVKDAHFIRKATRRHLFFSSKRLTTILYKLSYRLPFMNRNYPIGDNIFCGSCWWILTSECVKWMFDYHRNHPEYIAYYRHSLCSDEFFVQNIVANSKFATQIVPYKHYIDWSAQLPNPKILTVEDYVAMIGSGMWFARKFDAEVDSEILNRLDNQ